MAVIKYFIQKCKSIFTAIVMGNCCRKRPNIGPISVLLLGIGGSGKTEIGYALSSQSRIDFGSTKGVHVFNVHAQCQHVRLTEIGGTDTVRDIWPHYYNDAFGIVFVIDCSLQAPFDMMRDVLHKLMHNRHIRGKPLLIVANKQDLDQSIDIVDIMYFFRIDELCNLFGTPCWIVTSGVGNRNDLQGGMDWLVDTIFDNFKALTNRIKFNDTFTSPIKRFKRQPTSTPKRATPAVHARRICSAPSKISSRRATKINGYTNPPRIFNRARIMPTVPPIIPPATPATSRSTSRSLSSMFRRNTIILRHE